MGNDPDNTTSGDSAFQEQAIEARNARSPIVRFHGDHRVANSRTTKFNNYLRKINEEEQE